MNGTSEIDYSTVGGYGPESLPGHSGSETSEEAARRPGVGKKTMEVHRLLETARREGLIAREVGVLTGLSHGAASGALSRLHRAGLVERLTERRGRQQVYVAPEYVDGRETAAYRPNAAYREDRKPMPLERPEPTLESITQDLMRQEDEHGPTFYGPKNVRHLAPYVLEIVRKYR